MENIFRRANGWRWIPDADPLNAPEGTLLQADNTISDRLGARSVRLGSQLLYSTDEDQRVHSLYTAILQDVKFRLAGIDDRVYRNGENFGTTFNGEGDIQFVDDSYQVFMARSTTRKKFDGTNFHNWGIDAPEFAASVLAVDALTTSVATFDNSESPAFDINEGTSAFVDNYAGSANSAMSLTPNATTGRASASKQYSADQDFLNLSGSEGGPTDLFDIRVWLEDPRKVDKVTFMFGLGTGADPFVDDYYYFNFNIRNDGAADVKDSDVAASAAYQTATNKLLAALTPSELTQLRTPEAAGEVMRRLGGQFVGPQTTNRPDAQQNSPSWGHFAVTRGQFTRVGQTKDRDWSTVRGFKVVYTVVPGATSALYVDDAIFTGGGDRALTGTFQVGYRWARRMKDVNGNDVYTELSPMSPISEEVVLKQQTMQITIPASSLSGADPQVDTVWVYLYGGWLDTFYRFTVLSSELQNKLTIDELTNPSGSDFEDPEERVRLTSHGFSYAPGAGSGTDDLIFTIRKSETDALVENEVFEPGAVGPPENIIGLAGPQNKRIFAVTEEGWIYPSTLKSPSCFSLYHTIDARQYGNPFWIVKTNTGIYAGFSKDIIRIDGDGSESENHLIANLFATPMSVSHPPVDAMVCLEENTIVYRSANGLMRFNGASAQAVPYMGTSLLWAGENRHETNALNKATGRFRIGSYNHDLMMLAPEGDSTDPNAVWKFEGQAEPEWCRFVYPSRYLSIYSELDSGVLLAGTDDGQIHILETGNSDLDDPIHVNILTPVSEGNNPLAYKVPVDLQFHGNTGNMPASFILYREGDGLLPFTKTVLLENAGVYRMKFGREDFPEFLRIQARITGSFNTFIFDALNLQVITNPQHAMVIDFGEILPTQGEDRVWATQVEIDMRSQSDCELLVYKEDILHATLPITVLPSQRTSYTVHMPRNTHARRLGMVLKTTADDGAGRIGFEVYSCKVRHAITGNVTELNIGTGDSGSAGG